ncbi:MAG TPA: protein kinase [Polyangia bacterium]|jgi:serine/threonine-protein kinase|nr:protein kinase [Polyangia bacterium]
MNCDKCGTPLEEGARFCGACGARVEAKPAAAAPRMVSLDAPEPPAQPKVAIPVAREVAPLPKPAKNPALEQTMLAPAGRPATGPAPAASVTTTRLERKSENTGSRDDMVGRTLNKRYQVGEKVGEGGFGAVFRGKQLATGREVALKILHPYNLGDPTIVARFRREAEACSRLRNPHTVITYDFDETEDGVLYLAMEMLNGRSLHHLERAEGHLQPDRVLRLIDQVADALGEAHDKGIVHRDMKPENIFVEKRGDEDYVKVLDFGIAKMMTDERGQAALTAVGQTLGTLEFMSPEQLRGMPLDGRSDIYALGIMAYEMLTGDLPFKDAKTPVQIINFHMQKPAPPPSRLKPELQIPAYVDEVILKMVAKAREDRHADTKALRAHIARVLQGADHRADRFEVYRLAGVVGAAVLIISALVYFLSR